MNGLNYERETKYSPKIHFTADKTLYLTNEKFTENLSFK